MNQMVAQITLPVKCLRQGYRHLRLRSVLNQNLPLHLSTLFIYSSYEEEGLDIHSDTSTDQLQLPRDNKLSRIDLNKLDSTKIEPISTSSVKRRMFFLVVHGVIPEESSTILKITQDSTVNDVIAQALYKANKPNESVNDYVLLEEVDKGWEKTRPGDRSALTQRILDPNERPLEAQNNWKGDGKFILKRLADDPSTRAWMTTIRSASAHKENSHSSEKEISGEWEDKKRDENETFLVCIYNVSKDQPYTILKSLVTSTAQDIITQALHKAHRSEDPKKFVLVEEIENFIDTQPPNETKSNKNCVSYRRVLKNDENIYNVQTQWKNKGKFELKYHSDITANDNTVMKLSSLQQSTRYSIQMNTRDSLRKLSRMHRTYSKHFYRKESDDSLQRSTNQQERSMVINPNIVAMNDQQSRQVHSDGELSSLKDERTENDTNETNLSSFSRLKRLSMKRLKKLGNISK
ncbi:Phosphoinositide phospholipase C-like protein [Euroglyphus maynei]|uniref:Phosphoinositide phospholipase C-like protein n=1 Tax=Euroglyphus maynei TaxID=6958 RepID=A0A1Y3ALQ9_EURMA|nr:Phosphoinositide phospholipase C-like protein [Euroglyphus maynei]